jgi:hypothetical protein
MQNVTPHESGQADTAQPTPAMIEAGALVISDLSHVLASEALAAAVYTAMVRSQTARQGRRLAPDA